MAGANSDLDRVDGSVTGVLLTSKPQWLSLIGDQLSTVAVLIPMANSAWSGSSCDLFMMILLL